MKCDRRRKQWNVVSIMLTACLLAGVLTGCGEEKGGNDDPDSSDNGVALTGESIQIQAQTNGLGQDWLYNAAEAFTQETGIAVDVQFDAFLSQNLTNTFQTEGLEVADLYFVQTYEWAQWMNDGYTADLTDFMNEKDDSGKSLNEKMTSIRYYIPDASGEEKQNFVPLTNAPTGLAYNKQMMDYICHEVLGWEEGHDYPLNTAELNQVFDAMEQAPEENPDLFTYSQSGQTLDVKPLVWSGTTGMLEFMTFSWFYQYLGQEGIQEFYNQKANPDMLKGDAVFLMYQEIVDLLRLEEDSNGSWVSTTSIPQCVSFNHTNSQQQFLLNKALMCPTGSWFYSEMKETITDLDNIGFMPVPYLSDEAGNPVTGEGVEMPRNEDGSYRPFVYMNSPDFFIVPAKSQKQDLAKEFLRFLFSEDYLPKLQQDLQAPLCFEFDNSSVEKNAWFSQVDAVMKSVEIPNTWTTNKMRIYGKIGFYYDPNTAPFSNLSQSGFGNNHIWIDSATGQEISDASEASGIAVTENVYNYVIGNYNVAVVSWNEAMQALGGE